MLTVHSGAERLSGRCRGIDDRGCLVIDTEHGPHTIIAGSIESWE
jgi:hypothetical protein